MDTLDSIREEMRRDIQEIKDSTRSNHASNVIQFHGSAPGWTMAGVLTAVLCLGMLGIAAVMIWGMNERISDMQDRSNADAVELNDYKIANEARARTDRLLLNKIEVALAEQGIKP